jgi:RNA polymerase sigma-70 factor, ECF subfamily
LCRLGDEELMRLVADMNPDAFEVVYDRHCTAAFSLAYRICASRPAADDVCQEAFLAMWRSAGGFDPRLGSLHSWVLSIVHNRAIDHIRRATRHTDRQVFDEQAAEQLPAPDRTDEAAVRSAEAHDTRLLLDRIPAEQRRVIELAFYSGYTHQEIARMLKLPLGTVKGRMKLGLSKLHTAMAGATP